MLYGSFYISSSQLSELEVTSNSLKQKLLDCESKEKSIKDRDFRLLNTEFLSLFDTLGKLFAKRNPNSTRKHTV